MGNFKTYKLTYTAELVGSDWLNSVQLHEIIAKALRSEAGYIGYLVGMDQTALDQTGGEE